MITLHCAVDLSDWRSGGCMHRHCKLSDEQKIDDNAIVDLRAVCVRRTPRLGNSIVYMYITSGTHTLYRCLAIGSSAFPIFGVLFIPVLSLHRVLALA